MTLVKLKAYADEKFSNANTMVSVFDRVENIVGKGENAGNQHFLLFPQCFQNPSPSGSFAVGIVSRQMPDTRPAALTL